MRAIDLFAGAGGFSTGAAMAGCRVVWAANHWPAAVQVHANNHPEALHVCQDLQQADWTQVPALASCTWCPCTRWRAPTGIASSAAPKVPGASRTVGSGSAC